MGRLWQTVILMQDYPVFEFIPFETSIRDSQQEYYAALHASDREGQSTRFIEYMLSIIDHSIDDIILKGSRKLSGAERIAYFLELNKNEFSRKDYMKVFSTLSTATASRDLQQGAESGIIRKTGTGNKTKYRRSKKTDE